MIFENKAMCLMCNNVQTYTGKDCVICGASVIHQNPLGVNKFRKWFASDIDGFFAIVKNLLLNRLFDWYFNTDTTSIVTKKDLNVLNSKMFDEYGVYYSGTNFTTLYQVFHMIPIDTSKMVLLDLGSGKGKVMMYALLRGFKKSIGIEYSSYLVNIAKTNLVNFEKKQKKRYEYELINMDASQYTISEDVNVIFMFNPFSGEVMDRVIKNIISASKMKKIFLIFVNYKIQLPAEFSLYKEISSKTAIFTIES